MIRGTVRSLVAVYELVFISAVMQMGLALPMAYYFHRATTIGLPANLTVVPLIQLLMPAATATLLLGSVSPWLAKLPLLVANFALHGITGTVRGLGVLRLADFRVAMPSAAMIICAAGALIFAVLMAWRRCGWLARETSRPWSHRLRRP